MEHTHAHCWIQYTLLVINGAGYQPYETLSAINVHFSGGMYAENGIYYGHLSGASDACAQAIRSLNAFGGREVTQEELTEVIYRLEPINSIILRPEDTINYIGPVMFDDEGYVVREWSLTEWSAPVVPNRLSFTAPAVTIATT